MGKHYLYIDSHDKTSQEKDSNMTVYLNPPLERVHSVKVKSFSIANEMYNIVKGCNRLDFIIYSHSTSAVPPYQPFVTSHTKVSVEFPIGVFTTQELVDFFNEDISESKHTSNLGGVTMTMSLLANNKVQLVAESISGNLKHI